MVSWVQLALRPYELGMRITVERTLEHKASLRLSVMSHNAP